MEKICDLLVLGGGGSGLVAAAKFHHMTGKRVIVLEKNAHTGGGMVMASTMRTFDSRWQRDRGLDDMFDAYARMMMDATYWRLDPDLVSRGLRATGWFFDWFCSLKPGLSELFHPGRYVFEGEIGPTGPQRGGPGGETGGGRVFMDTLLEYCKDNGVEVLTRSYAKELRAEDGRINGAVAETPDGTVEIECGACVLATGSWINHHEVMERLYPEFNRAVMQPSAHTNPMYTGDGVALAEQVGALVDYDSFCLRLMGPMPWNWNRTVGMMYNSQFAVQVNLDGKRFACEPTQTRMSTFESGHVLIEQPEGRAFIIFDENVLAAAVADSKLPKEDDGGFFGHPEFPEDMSEFYAEVEKAIAEGNVYKADSIEELADKIGVDPASLKQTIEEYNAACEAGADLRYFKPKSDLVALKKAPYYALAAGLGTDGAFGGVLVNADMQAYAKDGGLVGGLYVTGDFSSGRFINQGGVKKQIINDMSWALASGYLAAEAAAQALK